MDEPIRLPAFPGPLRWLNPPSDWRIHDDGALTIQAGPRTDLFHDPGGPDRNANAPALLGRLQGDYMLSTRVRLDFGSTYDAGVLLLYAGHDTWAKLCLEYSPQGRPTIVSVVNRGVSDDCNSFSVSGDGVYLRVSRIGDAFALHAASGDDFWHLVRYFALDGEPEVGFLAQTPLGEERSVLFDDIRYSPHRLRDPRSGE